MSLRRKINRGKLPRRIPRKMKKQTVPFWQSYYDPYDRNQYIPDILNNIAEVFVVNADGTLTKLDIPDRTEKGIAWGKEAK